MADNYNAQYEQAQPEQQQQQQPPAQAGGKTCPECNQEIRRVDHTVNNGGQTFHSKCFTCAHCNEKLAGKPFFTQKDKRICKGCYNSKIAPKCAQCGETVTGESVTTGDKRSFHPNCFRCFRCNKVISASYRTDPTSGKMEHSYNCVGDEQDPEQPTKDGQPSQRAKDQCRDCGKDLVNVRFFILEDGMKVCDQCFKRNHCTTCYKCNKAIMSGQSHTVKDWKFHKECFNCPNCGMYMGDARLKIQDGQVCCFECQGQGQMNGGQQGQRPSQGQGQMDGGQQGQRASQGQGQSQDQGGRRKSSVRSQMEPATTAKEGGHVQQRQ